MWRGGVVGDDNDDDNDNDNNETTTTTMSLLRRVSRERHNNQIDHVEGGGVVGFKKPLKHGWKIPGVLAISVTQKTHPNRCVYFHGLSWPRVWHKYDFNIKCDRILDKNSSDT